ncbi:ferredoxin [Streptomyces sp. NPDC019531]|uniref:ferredoxin n=1 Tax=Streptomyces sp. NPDC019531 TaxID=3365062 RepID=UPI00384D9151
MSMTEHRVNGTHLKVDHSLCSGTGHCQDTAPDVFRVVDGWAWLVEDPELDRSAAERVQRAVAGCPWFAITLSQEADG